MKSQAERRGESGSDDGPSYGSPPSERPNPIPSIFEVAAEARKHVRFHTETVHRLGDHVELTITDVRGWPATVSGATLDEAIDTAREMIAGQIGAARAVGETVAL